MIETDRKTERFVLAGVILNGVNLNGDSSGEGAEALLYELNELTKTSGGEAVGFLVQNREVAHPATYLGKGKLDELKEMVNALDADGVICDDELTSAQMRHMESALGSKVKIMDRTMLILDIFAGRASSAEGKAQVELAQYKYRLSRLSGLGASLSRLGGGIGTRGPGEKKLETDRRHIRNRIAELNRELKEIQANRAVLRGKRERNKTPVVSMVGYTNAGKSTLMNALTGAGVLAEDKLFATLDTTTRKIGLPNGGDILFTDTVGFIQKLPVQLVSAFRATLEELGHADILVHVVDASNSGRDAQMAAVYGTLAELKVLDRPVITVYNKIDKGAEMPLPADRRAKAEVSVSALTGENLDGFLVAVERVLKEFRKEVCVLLPYAEGRLLNIIHETAEIVREEHTGDGIYLEIFANDEVRARVTPFLCDRME